MKIPHCILAFLRPLATVFILNGKKNGEFRLKKKKSILTGKPWWQSQLHKALNIPSISFSGFKNKTHAAPRLNTCPPFPRGQMAKVLLLYLKYLAGLKNPVMWKVTPISLGALYFAKLPFLSFANRSYAVIPAV